MRVRSSATLRTLTRRPSVFPRPQPRAASCDPFPVSTFVFPRLPTPELSDAALILMLYAVRVAGYYGQHGVWPWLSAPGVGEAVLP